MTNRPTHSWAPAAGRVQFSLGEAVLFSWLAGVIALTFARNPDERLLTPLIMQALLATAMTVAVFLGPPGSTRWTLRRHPSLLLPALYWIHINWLLDQAASLLPLMEEPFLDWRPGIYTFVFSTSFVLQGIVGFLAVAWLLVMANDGWSGRRREPVAALSEALLRLPAVTGYYMVAYLLMFLSLLPLCLAVQALGFGGLLLFIPAQFGLNLLAFTVLSSADRAEHRVGWFHAAGLGFSHWRRLFWPIAMATVVLGGFVYVAWSGTFYDPTGMESNYRTINHLKFNIIFTFDLRQSCYWYSVYADVLGAARDPMTTYFFKVLAALWSTLFIVRFAKEWARIKAQRAHGGE